MSFETSDASEINQPQKDGYGDPSSRRSPEEADSDRKQMRGAGGGVGDRERGDKGIDPQSGKRKTSKTSL